MRSNECTKIFVHSQRLAFLIYLRTFYHWYCDVLGLFQCCSKLASIAEFLSSVFHYSKLLKMTEGQNKIASNFSGSLRLFPFLLSRNKITTSYRICRIETISYVKLDKNPQWHTSKATYISKLCCFDSDNKIDYVGLRPSKNCIFASLILRLTMLLSVMFWSEWWWISCSMLTPGCCHRSCSNILKQSGEKRSLKGKAMNMSSNPFAVKSTSETFR